MRCLVCDCSCNWEINYLKQNIVLDYWSRDVEDIEAEIRLTVTYGTLDITLGF